VEDVFVAFKSIACYIEISQRRPKRALYKEIKGKRILTGEEILGNELDFGLSQKVLMSPIECHLENFLTF